MQATVQPQANSRRSSTGRPSSLRPPAAESRHRGLGGAYWGLWSAATVSSLGDGLAVVALPLLAARLTHNPALVSGLVFAQRLPWLLLSLPTGALADRLDRRRVMVAVDGLRAILVAALAVGLLTGHLGIAGLYGAAFGLGALETLFFASAHAVLPSIVARAELSRANGYLTATQTCGEMLAGPALGGLLFAMFASAPFLADGVSFLASAAVLAAVLPRRGPAPATSTGPGVDPDVVRTSLRREMAEGWRWFRGSALLRVLTVVVGGLAFCQAMVMSVLVLFGLETLHLSGTGYGLFLAAGAIGNVLGAMFAARLRTRFGAGRLLSVAAVSAGVAYVVVGTAHAPAVAAAAFILEAFAVGCGNVASVALRQTVVPTELLGRVGNVFRMFVWGAIPLGSLVGGALATTFGLRAPMLVAAAAQIVLALASARALRRRITEAERTPEPAIVVDLTAPALPAATDEIAGAVTPVASATPRPRPGSRSPHAVFAARRHLAASARGRGRLPRPGPS